MKDKRGILFLILVLVLATVLRVFWLNKVPVELFGDELDVGYHAYSLLKTGRDYTGHLLPTYISSLAEARAPLFIYSVVPFIAIFGLSEWGVRLSATFFGVLGVFLVFLLVKRLFKNEPLALAASFFLAIVPWHIHYSRAAYEVTLLLVLFLGGTLLFLKGLKKEKFFLPSAILLALTPYTYSTANLFLPLLIFSFLMVFRKKIFKLERKWIVVSFLTALIILLPLISSFFSGQAGDRFSKISIFTDKHLIDEVIIKRSQEGDGRFFHNKATTWGKTIVANYLTSFSSDFLFLFGDRNPRHGTGKNGELYLILLPLLLIGIWFGLRNIKKEQFQLIFLWLIFSPIPASLTQGGGNHATRLFLMLPPLIILISLGMLQILKVKKWWLKSISLLFIFLFLFIGMIFYCHQYFVDWPRESWRFWHYGYKEAMLTVAQKENDFDRLVFNNTHEPILLRFLFWTKKDPHWFHENFNLDQETERIFPEFLGFRLGDRYVFGRITGEDKMKSLLSFLDDSTIYWAFQKDDVPGDWNWQEETPEEVEVIDLVREYFSREPFIYLLTGQ